MFLFESVADDDETRIGFSGRVDTFLQFLQFAGSSEVTLQLGIFEESAERHVLLLVRHLTDKRQLIKREGDGWARELGV